MPLWHSRRAPVPRCRSCPTPGVQARPRSRHPPPRSSAWSRRHGGQQMLEAEREQVASACRRLAAEGLVVGTAGNVSVRAGDLVAITPTGANLADLSADQVSVVDLEGAVVG